MFVCILHGFNFALNCPFCVHNFISRLYGVGTTKISIDQVMKVDTNAHKVASLRLLKPDSMLLNLTVSEIWLVSAKYPITFPFALLIFHRLLRAKFKEMLPMCRGMIKCTCSYTAIYIPTYFRAFLSSWNLEHCGPSFGST